MRRPGTLFLLLAIPGCNAIFGIEAGEPRAAGGGANGGGGSGAGGVWTGECGAGGGGGFTGALRWAKSSTNSTYALATAVAFGASDDLVVAGMYSQGDLQLGNSTLRHAGVDRSPDIFLASLDRETGNPRWAFGFPAAEAQEVVDVAVAPGSGDIVISGWIDGTVAFGDGQPALMSNGGHDAFVARFTREGAPRWSRRFGDGQEQVALNVAFDGAGAVLFGAFVQGSFEFGGEVRGPSGSALQGLFLGKLGEDGGELWSHFYDTAFYEGGYLGLDADAGGNVVVTGSASSFAFGSSDQFRGDTDVYVLKLDKDGETIWSRLFGGTISPQPENGRQWGTAAAFDCAGDVTITGMFQKDLKFGANPVLTSVDPADQGDIFIARLRGTDGEPVWSKAFGDTGFQQSLSVATDALTNVVIGGALLDNASSQGIDFGGGVMPPQQPEETGGYHEDFFVAKVSPAGEHLWSHRIGDVYLQQGKVTMAPSGAVAAAGDFFFDIRFDGPSPVQFSDPSRDLFVTLFDP